MKIDIVAVGRLKAGPEFALVEAFLDRARGVGRSLGVTQVDMIEVEAPRALKGVRRIEAECEAALAASAGADLRILLDERGRAVTSADFAKRIDHWRNHSVGRIAFLIGGADGHGEDLRNAADQSLSFGPATWPHMLVRVMLAEQLYRALTILSGHPYHRA